tara:strand:- start:127 stop:246 length:120 start_codon:yes stop_codon:yes gene_type:complete
MAAENKKFTEIFLKRKKFNYILIKFSESASKIIQNDINY